MQDHENAIPTVPQRALWNKGKLIWAKPLLRPKPVWSIRTKLKIEVRTRDLTMFNLAIDSKLCGCDVVSLRVEDMKKCGSQNPIIALDAALSCAYLDAEIDRRCLAKCAMRGAGPAPARPSS
ncbi:MAG: hypothetical protein ACREDM_09940 [Methylocella sp.]